MNEDKKDEKKVYKPAGVVGEAVVIPVEEVDVEEYHQHNLSIQAGGQFCFSTNSHYSGLIKDNAPSYVGLYWDEETQCLTIVFDDKLEDQIEALNVMRLGLFKWQDRRGNWISARIMLVLSFD